MGAGSSAGSSRQRQGLLESCNAQPTPQWGSQPSGNEPGFGLTQPQEHSVTGMLTSLHVLMADSMLLEVFPNLNNSMINSIHNLLQHEGGETI